MLGMARGKCALQFFYLILVFLTFFGVARAALPLLLDSEKASHTDSVGSEIDEAHLSASTTTTQSNDLVVASRPFHIPKRYRYRGRRTRHRQWTNGSQRWVHRRPQRNTVSRKTVRARTNREEALIREFLVKIRRRNQAELDAQKRQREAISKPTHAIFTNVNGRGAIFQRYNAAMHTNHANMANGKPCAGPVHYVLSTTYAATCSCRQATGLHNGLCYSMVPNGTVGSCVRRKCRTEFVCDESGSAPWMCMRREVKFRVVPVGIGRCQLKPVRMFVYVPYTRKPPF